MIYDICLSPSVLLHVVRRIPVSLYDSQQKDIFSFLSIVWIVLCWKCYLCILSKHSIISLYSVSTEWMYVGVKRKCILFLFSLSAGVPYLESFILTTLIFLLFSDFSQDDLMVSWTYFQQSKHKFSVTFKGFIILISKCKTIA